MKLYREEVALAYELRQSGVELKHIARGLGVSVRGLSYVLAASESKEIPPRPTVKITKSRIQHTQGRARHHIARAAIRASAIAESKIVAPRRAPYLAGQTSDDCERETRKAVREGDMGTVSRPRGYVMRARKAASASRKARQGPFGDLAIAAQLREAQA